MCQQSSYGRERLCVKTRKIHRTRVVDGNIQHQLPNEFNKLQHVASLHCYPPATSSVVNAPSCSASMACFFMFFHFPPRLFLSQQHSQNFQSMISTTPILKLVIGAPTSAWRHRVSFVFYLFSWIASEMRLLFALLVLG